MPIVATYQSSTHQKIIQLVADQALDSARAFCERAKPGSAWMI
jgi:hypothetical protein